MSTWTVVRLLFAFIANFCALEYNDRVIVLNDQNFDEFKAQNPRMLVKFYAPWCVHCKSIAPGYSELAERYQQIRSDVKISEVNATGNPELSNRFNIQHYPTLLLFANEKTFEYLGEPGVDKYIKWMNSKLDFPLKTISTQSDLDFFKHANTVLFVGMFEKNDTSNTKLAKLVDIASQNEDDKISFGLITDKGLISDLSAKDGMLTVFKQFDEPRVDLEIANLDEISDFIKAHSIRLLTEFKPDTAKDLFTMSTNVLLFHSGKSNDMESLRTTMENTAKKFRGRVAFGFVDIDIEDNNRVLEYLGLARSDTPAIRLLNLTTPLRKYKFDSSSSGKITQEALIDFVQSYIDGNAKPYFKSQVLPDNWNKSSVLVLVRENFEEVVFNKSADVLVEFYAPWCGHCQRLSPVFSQLGDYYKDVDGVVIAKMDSTENELEQVAVAAFPTIKLFKRSTNEEVDYSDDRTLESMIKFIDVHRGVQSVPKQTEPSSSQSEDHEEL
ncbi:hypothetical protein ACOME3_009947 [Neoechinorhynchus agilis]